MNQVHLLCIASKEIGLLSGGVTAADHGDGMAPKKRTVTDRTIGHPFSRICNFARHTKLDRRAARRHDNRLGQIDVAGFGSCLKHPVGALPHAFHDDAIAKFRAKLRGVVGKLLRQFVPQNRLESRVIFNEFGIEQLATREAALEHDRSQH